MQLQARLYFLSAAIFVVGLCSASAVYFLNEDQPDAGDGYVIVDGKTYPAGVYQSKRYVRDLERFGGKANVIFNELNRWFASLWQGKKLGLTVGWLSAGVSLVIFMLARYLYPEPGPEDRDGK